MSSGRGDKTCPGHRFPARFGVLLLPSLGAALWLAGCVVPVPKGENPFKLKLMTATGLETYAEEVFRKQNRIMTRLMMTPLEEDDDSLSSSFMTRLENAEQRMNETCASLNEVAGARSRGEQTSLLLENRVRETVRDCDRAARRLEALLDEQEQRD